MSLVQNFWQAVLYWVLIAGPLHFLYATRRRFGVSRKVVAFLCSVSHSEADGVVLIWAIIADALFAYVVLLFMLGR